ncbi:MAG: tRNA (adenosine(37)-N6)-threonylcarbamoyltransferase complex dimerization subunit type 1 TsaB [Myxococcota bacterium]
MKVLALDTSGPLGTVAVCADGELLCEVSARVRARHGETLMPHVDYALKSAGVSTDEIDLVGCGLGPGSFTGLRVGVATAKGFAYALSCPIVGVSSSMALCEDIGTAATARIATIIDAHRSEVFANVYRLDTDRRWVTEDAPHPASMEATLEQLEAIEGPLVLTGSGVRAHERAFLELQQRRGAELYLAPVSCDTPRASSVARLAVAEWHRRGPADLHQLEPIYGRSSF